jgi:hypothetical protein
MLLNYHSLFEFEPPPIITIPVGAPAVLRRPRRWLLPELVRISPDTVKVLAPPFLLTANGGPFTRASHLRFDGEIRATTFVSDSELVTSVLPFDVRKPGVRLIDAMTPGIGASPNAVPLHVVRDLAQEDEDLLLLMLLG